MGKKITVVFEDHGQDFLEWDLEWDDGVRHPFPPVEAAYIVVGCRPFQEWAWKGTRVHTENQSIGHGILLEITTPFGVRSKLVHPVKEWRETVHATKV